MVSEQVALARQQVLDADRVVFGYELFFRDDDDLATLLDDPNATTRGVMERVLLQWGVAHVVGDRFGFINADPSLVVNGLHQAMPPEGIIIELCEPAPFGDATLVALRQARIDGYHFALDNVSRLGDLERSELLPLASIVKIELTRAHHAEIDRLIAIARERSPGVLVVAEKVETADDFARCIDHGFDLFQGYHLGEPEILRRPARRVSRRSVATLRSALANDVGFRSGNEEVEHDRIVAALANDPTLTFRLLLAVNADAFGLDRKVGSVAHAVQLLGVDKLRCLAQLLAATTDTLDDDSDAVRGAARAMTMLVVFDDDDQLGGAVTAALLSVTDQMYASPLADLLDELPLTDELVVALRHGHGSIGSALDIVRACERGDRLALSDLAFGRVDELLAAHQRSLERAHSPHETSPLAPAESAVPEPP